MVAQATVQAEDLWYVAIAPGETKVLTLEQLDDWFRLEVIDADTKVWQPGMSEWLPLSVVAGIEEPPTRPAIAPSTPRRAPSPPAPIAVASTPPAPKPPSRPVALSGPPPPPSARVPMPQRSVAAAPAPAPAPSLAPAVIVNGPWPVALSASRSPAPVESLRPHVLSGRPTAPPRSGGKAGRFVVGLAVFAGLGLTLYRNDVLREAAASAGQATNYQKLESALGGPGFGTPRSVEALVMPTSLSEAVRTAQRPVTPRTGSATTTTATTSASPSSEQHAGASANTGTTGSSASGNQPSPSPRAKGSAARAKDADEAPSKNLGIKGSSNKFDPLNGKL